MSEKNSIENMRGELNRLDHMFWLNVKGALEEIEKLEIDYELSTETKLYAGSDKSRDGVGNDNADI